MTKDDIIKMAREAGIEEAYSLQHNQVLVQFKSGSLERFAALVAAAEREACAKLVEDGYVRQFEKPWREDLAAAIRARGNT